MKYNRSSACTVLITITIPQVGIYIILVIYYWCNFHLLSNIYLFSDNIVLCVFWLLGACVFPHQQCITANLVYVRRFSFGCRAHVMIKVSHRYSCRAYSLMESLVKTLAIWNAQYQLCECLIGINTRAAPTTILLIIATIPYEVTFLDLAHMSSSAIYLFSRRGIWK